MRNPRDAETSEGMTQIQKLIELMHPNTDPAYLASQGLSKTTPKRFLSKISAPNENGCIIWTGAKSKRGYGEIQRGMAPHRPIAASIAAYILLKGPITGGLQVLHKCPNKHNSSCVNPSHLQLGSQKENMADKKAQVEGGFLEKQVFPKGEMCGAAKITNAQAEEIRTKYATGRYTQWNLAREYGLTQAAVWKIIYHFSYQNKREPSRNPAP